MQLNTHLHLKFAYHRGSIETLSRMMRHLSIKTTQIYAEVLRTKIDEDMTNLAKNIEGKYDLSDTPKETSHEGSIL